MRCPVCCAEVEQGPQCRRCRADLTLLFALEDRRKQVLDRACRCLSRGEVRRAAIIADGADALRSDAESRRLRAICNLLRGDFKRAWMDYEA